jgi:hypothetical protein
MNSITNLSLSRPGLVSAIDFSHPSAANTPNIGRPLDGLDINVGRKDLLDDLVYSKSGGGRISCPDGTTPSTTVEGQDVVVVCKPNKKAEPTTQPHNPSDTPILK